MKKNRFQFIGFALLLLVVGGRCVAGEQVVGGRVFHVDNTNPIAADTNPGSLERPLKTISSTLDKVKPGDTVLIHAGVYREMLRPAVSGKPGRLITFRAVDGDRVVIKGSDLVTGWELYEGNIWRKTNWSVESQQVFQDGVLLQQIGRSRNTDDTLDGKKIIWKNYLYPEGESLKDIKEGCFYFDKATQTLYVFPYGDKDPNTCQMEASVRDAGVYPVDLNVSYICLQDLNFRHNNWTAKRGRFGGSALVIVRGMGWHLNRITANYSDSAGLHINGGKHLIENSKFCWNGCKGIEGNGGVPKGALYTPGNIRISYCEMIGNNVRGFAKNHDAGGLKLTGKIQRVVLDHCLFAYNFGMGLWFDGECDNNVVQNSLVMHNSGAGIMYELASNHGRIVGNTVWDNANQGIYVSCSSNTLIAHNDVRRNQWNIVVHGMPRYASLAKSAKKLVPLKGNRIFNNLMVDARAGLELVIYQGEGSEDNLADYNVFVNVEGKAKVSLTHTGSYRVPHTGLASLAESRVGFAHSYEFTREAFPAPLPRGTALEELTKLYQQRGVKTFQVGQFERTWQTRVTTLLDEENLRLYLLYKQRAEWRANRKRDRQ